MTSIIETIPGTKAVEIIFFFGAENPLSNWHPAQFVVRDVTFRNAEQFMMYCKAKLFADEETALRIIEAKSPRDHKTLGRSVRGFDEVWAKQEPLLRCLYDAGDEAVKREAQIAYDASVLDHEQMLGRTAMCHEVDRDLWGAFSDLYKERNLYRPRVPETVAYVQQWFIDDKRKYPESYVGQQPT